MITVHIQNASTIPLAISNKLFSKWIQCAFHQVQDTGEITLRLVDEPEITTLNHTYRNKNHATNVLSFPYQADFPFEKALPYLGDIVLCVPVLKEESKTESKSQKAHACHLVMHACLHLQGFDHEDEKEAQTMESMEIDLVQQCGFSNPYTQEGEND